MPTATFSRRNVSRRQASSDIEQDQPTQKRGREVVDDEDDEEPPRLRVNGVKKEKKATSSRQVTRQSQRDENQDDGEDDDDRIDVDNFHDQALGRVDLPKLLGLSKEWQQMEKQVQQNWNDIVDVAASVADAAEGADADAGLAELDSTIKELIDIGVEMKAHEDSIDDIYQKLGRGDSIVNSIDRYHKGVKTRMNEYAKKTTRQKYAKSEAYTRFKHGIFEVQNPDTAIPPISEFIPREDGDDSDDEDELEMGGVTQSYTCPITLTPLVDPMTSQVCGHSFSEEAIRQTFRGSPSVPKKCPASGCNKSFKLTDLRRDTALAKKVRNWNRRNQRAADRDDAEEIVE